MEQIAELVVDGMLKVHRALEPDLLESTYWLPREWRPPWDQRRREAHGRSVMNEFVVFLRGLGVFVVNLLPSLHTDRDKRLWSEPGNSPAPRRAACADDRGWPPGANVVVFQGITRARALGVLFPSPWCINTRNSECSVITIGKAMLTRCNYDPDELLRRVRYATEDVAAKWV